MTVERTDGLDGLGKDLADKIRTHALESTTKHHDLVGTDPRHELIENSVTKSNFLARSSYNFSLVDKRVMEMMISKLNPLGMKLNAYQTVEINLYATEYAKAVGVSPKIAYRDLKNSVRALLGSIITTIEGKYKVERPLMFSAKYQESEGHIIASFHPEFLPHLIGLREQFTKYALADVLKFKSEYTWRIYEMCMSVKSTKEKTLSITVDDFRERLAMPTGYVWSNIDRILKKAQLEIQTNTKYQLAVKISKTGRQFTHLAFTVSKNPQTELAL